MFDIIFRASLKEGGGIVAGTVNPRTYDHNCVGVYVYPPAYGGEGAEALQLNDRRPQGEHAPVGVQHQAAIVVSAAPGVAVDTRVSYIPSSHVGGVSFVKL